MSGQLRTLKNRIRSVENTKKITKAMEMVAAAKLRRFQTLMVKGKAYADGLENLLKRLSQGENLIPHPLLEKREEKKTCVVLITSDTGLCGSYNLALIERAKHFLSGLPPAVLCGVGKMGARALERLGLPCQRTFTNIRTSEIEQTLKDLIAYLQELYLERKVDAIYVVYSHCLSVTSFEEVTEKILPLEKPEGAEKTEKKGPGAASVDYIFEPDPETILKRLIPLFFEARTRQVFLESFVSEQIARMRAMHQATENASEMIDSLVLLRNKVRQAAITKEIIEIVSGSQALKT